jgi:hypothetical protein
MKKYRGHVQCPCNHGEKVRNCHGEKIKTLQGDGIIEFVKKDLALISNAFNVAKEKDRRKKIERYIQETKRR